MTAPDRVGLAVLDAHADAFEADAQADLARARASIERGHRLIGLIESEPRS